MFVTGWNSKPGPPLFVATVVKFDADGSVDTDWSTNGVFEIEVNQAGNNNYDQPESVIPTCDGGLLVGGLAEVGPSTYESFVFKLDSAGMLDTNWSTDGILRGGEDTFYAQLVDFRNSPNQEIYGAGQGPTGDGSFGTITRILAPNN